LRREAPGAYRLVMIGRKFRSLEILNVLRGLPVRIGQLVKTVAAQSIPEVADLRCSADDRGAAAMRRRDWGFKDKGGIAPPLSLAVYRRLAPILRVCAAGLGGLSRPRCALGEQGLGRCQSGDGDPVR
jgi:hypothetical protein